MRKALTLLLGISIVSLCIAACGGSGGNSHAAERSTAAASSTAASGHASSASSRLSISAPSSGALMFSTRTLSAKAGTVMVTFTNRSPEGHNFTLAQANGTVLGATSTFSGGARTLVVHLKAGRYTYYCSVPGHRQAGMQGTLTVS